jgi:hypothetical protein
MPHLDTHRCKPATAVLVLILISLVLAACGGSSKSSSATTSASAPSATAPGATRGGRFAALRECLQKNGITLPKRTPGQVRPPGGGGLPGGGGGPRLPSGVTRAQYETAVKKCGGSAAGGFRGGSRFNSPAFKQALVKFASCMREHGVKVAEPNTSGKGPIFNTTGINTSGAQFKSAQAACRSSLRGVLPGAPGGRVAPGGSAP